MIWFVLSIDMTEEIECGIGSEYMGAGLKRSIMLMKSATVLTESAYL
jgi:hypothetical protein